MRRYQDYWNFIHPWLKELNMVLVLDPAGGLILYSGSGRVGRVLLPPSTTALLSQEIGALALDSKPGAIFPNMEFVSTPIQPSRKSSIMPAFPSTQQKDEKQKSFAFLSPVSADLGNATIVGIRDSNGREVTLAYSSGQLIRVTLPAVATSLVVKALDTVKQLLPRELALQLHGVWYSKRHAPGPTPTPAAEWDMFCKCILGKGELSSSSPPPGWMGKKLKLYMGENQPIKSSTRQRNRGGGS